MYNLQLWMRWSWRDLRARWLQVVAIALIIALGTGVFAGLGGQKHWRIESLDKSYDELNFHDLRMELADGSFVPVEDLRAALEGIEGVAAFETRLVVPTLVDASSADNDVVVRGEIVGMNVATLIDELFVPDGNGRSLTESDVAQNVAVVEYKFADDNGLEPGDTLRISGDVTLDIVGAAHSPEYFYIIPDDNLFAADGAFAPLFVSLETAQQITGREGMVNDAVFMLDEGADMAVVKAAVESHMAARFENTGFDLTEQAEDTSYELMYTDAEGDQETWDAVAFLFLIGAAFGAFNLAGRIVESQRRQIGISMALGLPRLWIALRPMLVGLQIAVLGTIFGLIAGLILSAMFASLMEDLLPMPYWDTSLYQPGFLRATLLGILLPFVATLLPVVRAVRVAPIDAIRSGYLIAKGGGLNSVLHVLPLPGKSFAQMPFRNLLRSPWRSLLTILGVSMAIILLTAFIGFLDSFVATVDRAEDAFLHQSEDRMLVVLDFFYPVENGEISGIAGLTGDDGVPLMDEVNASLILKGTLRHDGKEIDTALELHNFEEAMWVPKLLEGELAHEGVIISEKAADDLGVGVGDTLELEHPLREGLLAFDSLKSEVTVVGIHNNPMRPLSYMHLDNAASMNLDGTTNYLMLNPAEGVKSTTIKLALLTQPGVASVQAISEMSEAIHDSMDIMITVMYVVQVIVLLMAFLIAFNSTSINVDERVREISTMFAFGLRIRTVTRMQMVENLIVGILGTLVGVSLGWVALNAMLVSRVEEQLEDMMLIVTISPETLLVSLVLGVLVVTLTPLLSIRRMARMNIPDTLRVME